MTTQLDVLIAAAMEREQQEVRAQEELRREQEERRTAEQREIVAGVLRDGLSEELLALLDVQVQATPTAHWATFRYDGAEFSLDMITHANRYYLCVAGPDIGRREIGCVDAATGKLDEALLRNLGHWRERHGRERHGMDAEEVLEEAPF